MNEFINVVDTWVNILGNIDDNLYNDVISKNDQFSSIIELSNFGYTTGPFCKFPINLTEIIFQVPAAIEVPYFLEYYIGSLVDVDKDTVLIEKLKNFIMSGGGKKIGNMGYYIFADIHDINNYLSDKDKALFKEHYNSFLTGTYPSINGEILKLYDEVKKIVIDGKISKKDAYDSYLNPNSKEKNDITKGIFFNGTLKKYLKKTNIIVFSQNTFKNVTNPSPTYISLKSNNTNTNKKAINDRYFKQFFDNLYGQLVAKQTESVKKEEEDKKLSGDEDILTQTYYSFKNINDKWLCNPIKQYVLDEGGYPFNNKGKNLIDSFAFVDRAMNPIGDTVINPEILLDLFNDTNVSIFSVLSQLLSMNGFEFFPLQNFMMGDNDSWNDSFKISTSVEAESRSAYVCMYIGGSSSYPSNITNGFQNDGIDDISTTTAKDFNSNCPPIPEYDNQYERNKNDFPWRQVRAFRVKFGQQNQSMFSDMKIESKEYPETNESIQILARLAGDEGKNAPIPKGQNLYNLYENRAYRATVTGLGNAMIQPTQYFQLDNVPLYNGAYLILSVEHDITANKMTTSFTGTKILRYPIPRVTNPAAAMGFEGGASDATDPDSNVTPSVGNAIQGAGNQVTAASNATNVADMAKYNSMYNIKII